MKEREGRDLDRHRTLDPQEVPIDPELRVLAQGSFANRFGAGAVMTTSALYFTRQVGFSATQVALAMSVVAVAGIVVQVPAGHLGDARGPRQTLTFFMAGAALFSAPLVFARSPWAWPCCSGRWSSSSAAPGR